MRFGGRFLLGKRLGAGGLAEVFEATDERTGQQVALKVLHRHLAGDPQLCERFRRELRAARSLSHPAVVRVFDLHEDDGRPAFSMELLEGETLAERLAARPSTGLPLDEVERIGQALCDALGEAHRAGIVHRDVKPQNVFLGRDGAVKLLDFGLSRVAGQARLTAQSVVMGTPGYVAPEILEGQPSDGRADLWALGATLYEMCTGKRAFPGRDPFKALASQKGPPPSARELRPEVPESLDRALRRALDPDPGKRFLDAGQLSRALQGLPVAEPPPQPLRLTAGAFAVKAMAVDVDLDVAGLRTLLKGGLAGNQQMRAVGARLQHPDLEGFGFRVAHQAQPTVAHGLSRRSADEVARLCRAEGLGALVVSEAPAAEGWVRRLARKLVGSVKSARRAAALGGAAVGLSVGGALAAGFAAMGSAATQLSLGEMLVYREAWLAFLTVGGGMGLVAGGFAGAELLRLLAALRGAPQGPNTQGDPAVAALAERTEQALQALQARLAVAPQDQQMLLDELRLAAEAAVAAGRALAERVGQLPDPLASPDLVETAAAGLARPPDAERDSGMQRLLRLAAAVESAVAAAEPAGTAPASAELRRLAEDLGGPAAGRTREQ